MTEIEMTTSTEAETSSQRKPDRGELWPFLLFLLLAFCVALPATFLLFAMAAGDMQSVAVAFMEGGLAMYGLLLLSIVEVLVFCVLGYFYMVTGRLPSSLLLLPSLLPLALGLVSAKSSVAMVSSTLNQAAPEQLMNYAFRGLSISMHPLVLGALVGSSMLGLATLSATMRSIAWAKRGARSSKLGWAVLGGGLLSCGVVVAKTCFAPELMGLGVPLGLSSLVAVALIGLGTVRPPTTWRDGACRWLLVVAGFTSFVVMWLAMRGAAYGRWAGALDISAPEQRLSFWIQGQEMEAQLETSGLFLLAVLGLAAVISLVAGGRQALAGAAKFRVSAAVTALSCVGVVAAAIALSSSKDTLLDEADRGDGTYAVRQNEGYRPATSTVQSRSVGGLRPTVIINPDYLWVDEDQVVATSDFAADGEGGRAVRAALEKSLDAWEEHQNAMHEALEIEQEEIADWVTQEAPSSKSGQQEAEVGQMGRRDAKKSDNRFGIKGPADNSDSQLARERAKEYAAAGGIQAVLENEAGGQRPAANPWAHLLGGQEPPRTRWSLDAVNVAAHREVPFSTVREVVLLLRGMGFRTARLLVGTPPVLASPRAEQVDALLERTGLSAGDYGGIDVVIGPGQCTGRFGLGEVEVLRDSLSLALNISERGVVISASGGVLPEGCSSSVDGSPGPTVPLAAEASTCTDEGGYPSDEQRAARVSAGLGPPPCAYDFRRLRECIVRIKDEYPDEQSIIISVAQTIDFQTVVRALDAARGDGPYTDTQLFPHSFLFVGADLHRTCHPPRAPHPPLGVLGELGSDPGEAIEPGSGSGYGYGRGAGGLRGRRGSVPVIRTGTATVRGSLSREVIRRYIRRHINQIRYCYEQQLARHPDLSGRMTIRFVISSSGAVSSSGIVQSTLGQPAVDNCVARTVQRIAFPRPEGGGVVIVTYPFMFEPAD